MAFPYIFESNFEQGTNAEWDSETDTEGSLTFPHYSQLARYDQTGVGPIAPYRGAYAAQWVMAGDTADHTLIEADIVAALGTTVYTRFYVFVGNDLVSTVADTVPIFQLQGTGDAVNAVVGLVFTTENTVRVGVGKTTPSSQSAGAFRLSKGAWHCFELVSVVNGGGTGTETLWVDGAQMAELTGITHIAIVRGVLGVQDALTTTTGSIFISDFIFDDTRIYPYKERYPDNVWITKSQHIFVGPGWIDEAAVTSAAGSLTLYDTDVADINNAEAVVDLNTSQGRSFFDGGAEFKRGCYAVLSAGHEAEVRIHTGAEYPGQYGPGAHWSAGAVRRYGQLRKVRP
jgi:hypothetical protein